MGKLIVLLCFALLAMTVVMAVRSDSPGSPGSICTTNSDCCCGFVCNPRAGGPWVGGLCTGRPGGMGPGGPVGLGGP